MNLVKNKKQKDIIIQENEQECIQLIEQSFLHDIFKESITDF